MTSSGLSIQNILDVMIGNLRKAGIENPSLDARLLIGHALGLDRAQLLSQSDRILSIAETAEIDALLARRMERESVARIIGKREFWGLDFALNEATLEPRPDSETVIGAILSSFRRKPESSRAQPAPYLIRGLRDKDSYAPQTRRDWIPAFAGMTKENCRVLDLGTGTGCLLLALLHELPDATGIGIDINPRAVEQATQNAASLGLTQRAAFRVGNWLDGIAETFDIIISNPPYIPASDIPGLMPEVRDYDPLPALIGGADGLDPYRLLIPQLTGFLNPHGLVAFEVGQGQAQQVVRLLQQNNFTKITDHKDLGGIERCVTASLNPDP